MGEEVLEAARRNIEKAERFFPRRGGPGREAKNLFFDLWSANTAQLVEAGLRPQAVETARICTICHDGEFFSYRAAGGGPVGHFAFLIGLR